jgi:hypothetical protein
MATFKVVWEITIEAKNSLEAAKEAQSWFENARADWQFYVQELGSKQVDSVDLSEDDRKAVLPVKNYQPLIKR